MKKVNIALPYACQWGVPAYDLPVTIAGYRRLFDIFNIFRGVYCFAFSADFAADPPEKASALPGFHAIYTDFCFSHYLPDGRATANGQ